MTPAEIIELVNLLGELASKTIDAYDKMHALAKQAGVTEADLAAADARFGIEIHDPLAGTSTIGDGPEPPVDPSSIEYATKDEAVAHVTPAYPNVIAKADGKFVVWPQIGPFPGTQVYP